MSNIYEKCKMLILRRLLSMKKIMIVSGHTMPEASFANKIILERLAELLPEADIDRLAEEYPDWKFDIEKEQKRLTEADVIVWQFPIFWYGQPSLLHKWQEEVFTHGFAYGSEGTALTGKTLVLSFTTGAPEELYAEGAPQNYPIEAFLPALKNVAALCNMKWGGFVYSGAMARAAMPNDEAVEQLKERAKQHAERLVEKLKELGA